MPPRKKPKDENQTDLEEAIAAKADVFVIDPSLTADLLIKRELELDDYLSAQSKAFADFCKPFKQEIEAIRARLLAMLLEQKTNSFITDFGTAYKSEIMQQKIDINAPPYIDPAGDNAAPVTHVGREALLYWCLDNWDKYGNEGLTVGVPIATVKQVMEDTGGHPPPGITVSYFTRINVKRS